MKHASCLALAPLPWLVFGAGPEVARPRIWVTPADRARLLEHVVSKNTGPQDSLLKVVAKYAQRGAVWQRNRSYLFPGWHFFQDVKTSAPCAADVPVEFTAPRLKPAPAPARLFIPGAAGREYSEALAPATKEAPSPDDHQPDPVFVIRQRGEAWTHHLTFTTDPEGRAISGQSSGGICAFTAAWERPDSFHTVVSFIDSFTSIAYRPAKDGQLLRPGGDLYPTLIRKNPIKPLKIFLQDGAHDLNNSHGNWFLANQQMLSALEWANANADTNPLGGPRCQLNHAWGDGAHSGKHGAAIFPDVLRWLWAGYQPKP